METTTEEKCRKCRRPKRTDCKGDGVQSDERTGFLVRHMVCPQLKAYEAERGVTYYTDTPPPAPPLSRPETEPVNGVEVSHPAVVSETAA